MTPLRIRAVNTAAESENKIHDDQVAEQYGFRGGLVPGVTVYGYLAQAALRHFGNAWLDRGAMDVRFQKPVYDGETVQVTCEAEANGRVRIEIEGRAAGVAWMHSEPEPERLPAGKLVERREPNEATLAPGVVLGTLELDLDLEQSRMSLPIAPAIEPDGFAHPAVLLALANRIFVENYELGPWIHLSSEVRKFSAARDGESIAVRAAVVERFERKGHEFVVLNVWIESADGRLIEYVRHSAIWRLRSPAGAVA